MNVLVAYDGSAGADAALQDLLFAGLPRDVNFRLLSVADIWPELVSAHSSYDDLYPHAMAGVRAMAYDVMAEAHGHCERGAQWLSKRLPHAKVTVLAVADSPSHALVRQAEDWRADLLVVGSHGASLVGRIVFGSVSHQVLTSAPCSVRVGRRSDSVVGEPLRIIVGVDGSVSAAAAVHSVAQRSWPPGTATRVVVAVERPLSLIMPGAHGMNAAPFEENGPSSKALGYRAAQAAAGELHRAGLSAVPILREGSPKGLLLEEADEWDADCIFVGAHGLRKSDRLSIGSVATAVATRARCSVEVVRTPAA